MCHQLREMQLRLARSYPELVHRMERNNARTTALEGQILLKGSKEDRAMIVDVLARVL